MSEPPTGEQPLGDKALGDKPLRAVRPGPLAQGRATDPYRIGVDPASPAVPTTGPSILRTYALSRSEPPVT